MAHILPNTVTRALRSLERRVWDLERQGQKQPVQRSYAILRWSFAGFIYVSDAPPAPFPVQGTTVEFGAALGTAGTSTTTVRFDFGQGTVDLSMASGVTTATSKASYKINPLQILTASVETAGTDAQNLSLWMSYLATPQGLVAQS